MAEILDRKIEDIIQILECINNRFRIDSELITFQLCLIHISYNCSNSVSMNMSPMNIIIQLIGDKSKESFKSLFIYLCVKPVNEDASESLD